MGDGGGAPRTRGTRATPNGAGLPLGAGQTRRERPVAGPAARNRFQT